MTAPSDATEIPVYDDRDAVEAAYAEAERQSQPFYGIERYDEGYAVTCDLLPADGRLTDPAHEEAVDRVTSELEAIVADSTFPTTEAGRSVGDSLVSVGPVESEEGARRIAAAVVPIVLDETNWAE